MSKTPFDAAHQKTLRKIVGRFLKDAGAQHIAEAIAAGYGFRTHNRFLEAMQAAEGGQPAAVPVFDFDAFVARLGALGESVAPGARLQLQSVLEDLAEGPLRGPPAASPQADPSLARRCLASAHVLMHADLWEEASSLLGTAMANAPEDLKPDVAAALEAVAPHSLTGTQNLVMALLQQDGIERDLVRVSALLEQLATSSDQSAKGFAENWRGHIARGAFGGRLNEAAGLKHFEAAARFGHAEAAFNAALAYDKGGRGVPKSAEKAREFYRIGVDHGHAFSMTNLAILMLDEDLDEAMTLLERAEERGDSNAGALTRLLTEQGMAAAVAVAQGAAGTAVPPTPVRVVPVGAWRAEAVSVELGKLAHCSRKEREEITAYLYGFGSWPELIRTIKKGKVDLPDEKCSSEEVRRRRDYQAQALVMCSDMDEETAREVIDALKPTAGQGKPSLDGLGRRKSSGRREGSGDGDDFAGAMADFMERLGLDPGEDPLGALDCLRTLHPVQPEVWLAAMAQHLGWIFEDVDAEAERDGSLVATAISTGGWRIPVFMSAVAYVPGDEDDVQVNQLKERIVAEHPQGAVLIFNKPAAWIPKSNEAGMVYGGLLHAEGEWSDFALRPSGGLDDALYQRGHAIARPSQDVLNRFGFSGARALAQTIAVYLAGLEPGEPASVMFMKSASGWALPLASRKSDRAERA